MKVKIDEDYLKWVYSGFEFTSNIMEVESQDDGFWTNCPFYAGHLTDKDGRKIYVSVEQDECEEV